MPWFDKYHIDGMRVDAVASMLYLDYCRKPGEWLPNQYGEKTLRQLIPASGESTSFSATPGILSIAEESTDWPMVSWPTYMGDYFNLKWNMGWMMLDYFSMDPGSASSQNNITFSMWYHHSENYMLALSHDEVVHGKSNIIGKMPGIVGRSLATLFVRLCSPTQGRKLCSWVWSLGSGVSGMSGRLEWHLLQHRHINN